MSLALTDGAGGAIRPPCYQSDLYARSEAAAVPEPAERAARQLFYLQPADNRVEIDRSCRQRLPVCQHQMAAPALTLLDRSSLTLSASAQDSQGCYGSPPRSYLSQLYADALLLPSAKLLPIQSSENTPGHSYIYCTHAFVGQTLYFHVCAGARYQYRARLNNLILFRRNKLMLYLKEKGSSNPEKLREAIYEV